MEPACVDVLEKVVLVVKGAASAAVERFVMVWQGTEGACHQGPPDRSPTFSLICSRNRQLYGIAPWFRVVIPVVIVKYNSATATAGDGQSFVQSSASSKRLERKREDESERIIVLGTHRRPVFPHG